MSDRQTVQDHTIVSDEDVHAWARKALQRALHVERSTTRPQIAADSGINIHTIDAWNSTDPDKLRPISFAQGLSLAHALGPRAVSSFMALIGYEAKPLGDGNELQPMQIAADAMGHLSVIARNAADGRIDHTEEAETAEAADQIIATVLPLSSAGKGAK